MSRPARRNALARAARRSAAVMGGKLAFAASRAVGRGGTALPGLIAIRLHPEIAGDLASHLTDGSVAVTGTNGKTTTCRILSRILSDAGYTPVRNESGSNLMRGVAAALVERATLRGAVPVRGRTIGIFEIDEAALPDAAAKVCPGVITLLDLFRDQLDRYGEVASISRLWEELFAQLPPGTSLVVNGDDPLLVHAVEAAPGAVTFFGVELPAKPSSPEYAGDVKSCPRCGGPIQYDSVTLSHLGQYHCPRCGLNRPRPHLWAGCISTDRVDVSSFDLHVHERVCRVHLPLPGLYNVYNAVAAAAVAAQFGVSLDGIAASLARVTPAFGRMERIQASNREVVLALAKNPAGFNQVTRAMLNEPDNLHMLVMLNDNAADGRDVSWIWDADIEALRGKVDSVVFSGTRAFDMALRFKYAEVPDGTSSRHPEVLVDAGTALTHALSRVPEGGRLFIIPTYTALLRVRDELVRKGHARQYWEQS